MTNIPYRRRECINRVCEAAGLKTVDRKRKVSYSSHVGCLFTMRDSCHSIFQIDKRVVRAIGDHPNMRHAGSNVKLSISSTCLALKLLDTDTVIAMHDMPRISFASGGDAVSDHFSIALYTSAESR